MSDEMEGKPLDWNETPDAWTFKSDAVAQKFDDHVREQLPWYTPLSRYVADMAVSFLPRGGLFYDIGASTGNITKLLADDLNAKDAEAWSIEPSHQMAKLWEGHGDLSIIEAENIDFTRRPPDVSILFLVLMFMKTAERTEFLGKLFAATQPGGAVIIVDKGYVAVPEVQVACKAAQLAGKLRSGTPGDSYVKKELSLRGEQRPTDAKQIQIQAVEQGFVVEQFFRFGEFYGLAAIKKAI
jgi:tRNA (cmo5U34)-methyltransferase